jgi:hypothetical protein
MMTSQQRSPQDSALDAIEDRSPLSNWTHADQSEAMSMGWLVADMDSTGKLEIQRYDDAPGSLRFESDASAREWVELAAALGNDLETRALHYVSSVILGLEDEDQTQGLSR